MVLSDCVKILCWWNLKLQNSCSPMWWSIYRVEKTWMLIFVGWSPHRLLLHFVIYSILIILPFHLSQQLSPSCDMAWAYKQKQMGYFFSVKHVATSVIIHFLVCVAQWLFYSFWCLIHLTPWLINMIRSCVIVTVSLIQLISRSEWV